MFSFRSISVFATLACAVLSAAVPLSGHQSREGPTDALAPLLGAGLPGSVVPHPRSETPNILGAILPGGSPAPSGDKAAVPDIAAGLKDVGPRCNECDGAGANSLVAIVLQLEADLAVHIKKLQALVAVDVTVKIVGDIVADIILVLNVAIAAVVKIQTRDLAVLLATVKGVISIKAFAEILIRVVVSLLLAIKAVLAICLSVNVAAVLAVFLKLGLVIQHLIVVILAIVPGLLVEVAILLKVVLEVLVVLKLDILLGVCGYKTH